MTIFDDGKDFGIAACDVLGFPAEGTMKVELVAEPMQVLTLKFTVAITNAQLTAILRAMQDPEAAAPSANTEGVAGHPVQHVDAPGDDDDTGLPETVWVPFSDVALGQSQHASATDKEKGVLLQVIMLTDEQMAKIDTYVRG